MDNIVYNKIQQGRSRVLPAIVPSNTIICCESMMVEAFHWGSVGYSHGSNRALEGCRQQVEEQGEQLLASSSLLKEAEQRSELAERRLLRSQDLLAVGSRYV